MTIYTPLDANSNRMLNTGIWVVHKATTYTHLYMLYIHPLWPDNVLGTCYNTLHSTNNPLQQS